MTPEVALIIGAFWQFLQDRHGVLAAAINVRPGTFRVTERFASYWGEANPASGQCETWYCRMPAIVEKWPPPREDFARRRSDAGGGDVYGSSPFGTISLCLDAPNARHDATQGSDPWLKSICALHFMI
jgi:hypothetical protein